MVVQAIVGAFVMLGSPASREIIQAAGVESKANGDPGKTAEKRQIQHFRRRVTAVRENSATHSQRRSLPSAAVGPVPPGPRHESGGHVVQAARGWR